MTETVFMEDVVDGARLLAFGMRPKLIPSRDLIYAELVKRFAEGGPFRELTETIAEGLGLKVLAVSSRTGVVLGQRRVPFSSRSLTIMRGGRYSVNAVTWRGSCTA
jgi:hypothetical protein